MASGETTARLATFASELTIDDIPDDVVARVKLLFADALASALAGWNSSEARKISAMCDSVFGEGDSTLIGAVTTVAPAAAATINGYLITARSVCDVHQPTLCHVTPVVVPPVMCLAEERDVTGPELVAALTAGMEVTVRVGLGLEYPEFRSRGWHSPGVAGLIGASAGAARLLGFDAAATEWTIGVAASQAGGTFASFGTPTIKFHQARAAHAALIAAALVAESFRGPVGILTNPDGGIFSSFSRGGDSDAALAGLGQRWELMEITTRLWPAAAALQSVLTIIDESPVPAPTEIHWAEVALPTDSYRMNAHMGWGSLFEATLSARYATSMALHRRSFWDLTEDTLSDLELSRFAAEHVSVVEEKALPEGGARLTLQTSNGVDVFERRHPRGSPRSPASWEDVAAKMYAAGGPLLGDIVVERLLQLLAHLETLPNVGPLITETRPVKDG